ncbi:DNA polymerase II large subunit [uncultured archaeon]|nr:DNA polymerase II large subunit [uncultured archaeon]
MSKEKYHAQLLERITTEYAIAEKARKLGYDPALTVEALPAGDLADRVEGLVGPPGIAKTIREIGRAKITSIIDSLLPADINQPDEALTKASEQAIRTALAILTEGVVAAPIEGISEVAIKTNPDGSRYLSISFAGPIRSAGGTAQGLAVLIGDYIRRKLNLKDYRPTEDEIERYVEEVNLYHERASHLQYRPPDEAVRTIVRSASVCVDGDPTEEIEVSAHRDLPRIASNRIRGGACLVIAEGIAQKAPKIQKISKQWGLDWSWLSQLTKAKATTTEEQKEDKVSRFMEEIVGGRPIFAAPGASGAFRLRYGRTRTSGITAKSVHPATMILSMDFMATGTQMKVEHPGKGCVITACDSIEPPTAKLLDGTVLRVETAKQAREINNQIKEVLFLGDILVSYGDFLQSNHALMPAGYCEEWWLQELAASGGRPPENLTPEAAVALSAKHNIPLHPKYTYAWEDHKVKEIKPLVEYLLSGKLVDGEFVLFTPADSVKRTLETLGIPHKVERNQLTIPEYLTLLTQLGLIRGDALTDAIYIETIKDAKDEDNAFEIIRRLSTIPLRKKIGTYVGCRMGRPEKARERKMQPPVHSLFPIGNAGGRERSLNKAAENETVNVDVARFRNPVSGASTLYIKTDGIGAPSTPLKYCETHGWVEEKEKCPACGKPTAYYGKQDIPIRKMWLTAVERIGRAPPTKAVIGMISEYKIPEPMEKGILRAQHDVYVFKDGTCRFDATDVPLTHFKPKEIKVSPQKLTELGYTHDIYGNPLENPEQTLELKPQDILLAKAGGEYLKKVADFIDELLTKLYDLPPYYKLETPDDLVGHLVAGLAPHTSAAVVGRVIGFTDAHVGFAHPFWHAAKRRNCDGDEDAVMLLLDGLINFSRKHLPEKRGGKMDAPLVVTKILDPLEIDDEAHKIEFVPVFPSSFYEATWKQLPPSEAGVPTVADHLKKKDLPPMPFTHDTTDITGPVVETRYVSLNTMDEKVEAQLKVAERFRAIDEDEVASLIINSHFIRDIQGNLRAFSRQHFRCVDCNQNYRRIPLAGRCVKCGGKLLLTVTEGNIRKYLDTSIALAETYDLSPYLKQRLNLLKSEVFSVFTNQTKQQASLADFM